MLPVRLQCLVYLFCLWIFGPARSNAQSPPSGDSLTVYLKTHNPTDTAYIRVMDKVIFTQIYKKADYKRADSLSQQMATLATRINDWRGVVAAHRNRAMIHYLTANFEQALVFFQKTLAVAEQHAMPPEVIYKALGNVATGHEKLGHDEQVLQTALRAIQYQERYQIKPRAAIPHRLIGGTLVKMGKVQQALPYYQEAGTIFRENGDQRGIAIFENQLGDLYIDLKKPRQALVHFRKCLQMAEQMQFELLQADALDGLAMAMRSLKRPAEGLPFLRRALRLAEKQNQPLGIATSYGSMALLYQEQQDFTNAELYFKKAIALANEHNFKDDLKKYTQQLADLYAQQNKFQQAYVYQLKKNTLTDSATLVHTNAEIQRLVAKYEAHKKEAQIRLLQKEKQLQQEEADRARWQRNALLIGALLIALLSLAITAWLLNRARLRRLQEALALRQQIAHDLHDEVGSTLSSISLLSGMTDKLLSQSRAEMDRADVVSGSVAIAEPVHRMVQKIYTDARQILDAMDEIIWTINPGNDSLHRIALRLQEYAQPLMESKQIEFSFSVDPSLDQLPVSMEIRRNLYLIGKEAINNLVKYSEATQAVVRFVHENNQLKVLIEDNGRGFNPAKISNRTGQQSMQERAKAISGTLRVESVPGQGTKLELIADFA